MVKIIVVDNYDYASKLIWKICDAWPTNETFQNVASR